MKTRNIGFGSFLSGLAIGLAILTASVFCVEKILDSKLYGGSRLVRMILSQDSTGLMDIASDRRGLDMTLKFVGALTSAYIDFELIPVNETGSFAAVFESVTPGVTIDRFEYQRKNFIIYGTSSDKEDYEEFIVNLESTRYFENIIGHNYTTTYDTVHFVVQCAPPTADAVSGTPQDDLKL